MSEPVKSILILNQAWGPLLRDFADELAGLGFQCSVFMGVADTRESRFRPEVRILRGPELIRRSIQSRFFSWLAYSFAAIPHLLRCGAGVRVVVFSNPPIAPIFVYLCSVFRGFKYSVVVYDIYPDIVVDLGVRGSSTALAATWHRLNRLAYQAAFEVVTLGPVMEAVLREQFDPVRTGAGRLSLSRPWVDTERVRPLPKSENAFAQKYALDERLTVLYLGNRGESHDMETILAAAALLEGDDRIEFLLGSREGERAPDMEAASALSGNVRVLAWQPGESVGEMWAAADVALVSMRPGAERYSFPSRTAWALAAGCALVAITRKPSDLAAVIEQYGCGEVVSPGDAPALVQCLLSLCGDRTLLAACRTKARVAAVTLFRREENVAVLVKAASGNC